MRKSIWIPSAIFIYFFAIAFYFAEDWIRGGKLLNFIILCSFEIFVIIGSFIFLRKKERFAEQRKNNSRRTHYPSEENKPK